MALSRRTGQRFQASIWPGFVDAMTGLLLVLFFVLSIFMVVQFALRETITGQESELDELAGEVAALAQALGLEQQRGAQLDTRVGELSATLNSSQNRVAELSATLDTSQARVAQLTTALSASQDRVTALTAQRDQTAQALATAESEITSFEAQVATLINQRDGALDRIGALEAEQTNLLSEQEALNLALADARTEIDDGVEAARLAAAKREALEALIADLEAQAAETQTALDAQSAELDATQTALTEEEALRLAEAAAAQALRERLENADTELTAMTLSLEAQRKDAEDTLTLLAAAKVAQEQLDEQLLQALTQVQNLENSQDTTNQEVQTTREEVVRLQSNVDELEQSVGSLEAEVTSLNDQLLRALSTIQGLEAASDSSNQDVAAAQIKIAELETKLDQAVESEKISSRAAADANQALQAARDAGEKAETGRLDLQRRLALALAAQQAAETQIEKSGSEADWRAALLATAQKQLSDEKEISLEAQRQTELLNQQVAALRTQLGELQGLLDAARAEDEAREVQLQSLGSELNTALARVAAEERRRARLEEAERLRLEAEALDLERYRSEFFGQLRDLLGTQEGVRIVGDRFVFSSEVLFAPGAANLSPAGQGEIAKIASILRDVSDEIPSGIDWVLQVDGHTDNVPLSGNGEFADNWELSQGRALSVVKYMVNFLGLPPDRLSANGFGQYQPLNLDDTPVARAQNRRIEIKFTEK